MKTFIAAGLAAVVCGGIGIVVGGIVGGSEAARDVIFRK